MKKRIQQWFSSGKQQAPASGQSVSKMDDGSAAVQNEQQIQRESQLLRMEVEALNERIERLAQENARLRERQDALIAETVTAKLEALVGELASPASQIRTQAFLSENQDKPVQAQDILAVARRMLRGLERHGVRFEGEVGEQVAFDPNMHTPMNSSTPVHPGDPVKVRFSGVRYQGKIVYKAIVE